MAERLIVSPSVYGNKHAAMTFAVLRQAELQAMGIDCHVGEPKFDCESRLKGWRYIIVMDKAETE